MRGDITSGSLWIIPRIHYYNVAPTGKVEALLSNFLKSNIGAESGQDSKGRWKYWNIPEIADVAKIVQYFGKSLDEILLPEDDATNAEYEEISASEGSVTIRQHLHRERDRAIIEAKRRQVLSTTGKLACSVCNFDFEEFYGNIGASFCEIHHLRPLADSDSEVQTRLEDLAVVCPNCHRMIHRSRPFLTLKQLKSKIRNPALAKSKG